MGSRYVEVDHQKMTDALKAAGFLLDVQGGEVVATLRHQLDQTMVVKIYTSLSAVGGDARPCGEDAIRVVLLFERFDRTAAKTVSGCLYKASRVFRTGSTELVIQRTLERAREAYVAGTLRHHRVPKEEIEGRAKAIAKVATRERGKVPE